MSELVKKLLAKKNSVILERVSNGQELKERIDIGMVHVKFPNTRGETVLGIPVNGDELELDGVDFEKGTGNVEFAGDITLDYVDLRCAVKIDLKSLKGEARLKQRH